MTETGLSVRPVLPPAIQKQLGLNDPRFRPLSDLKTVLRDLGEFEMDLDTVRALIESGVMIAFNIAVDLDSKAELRVLTKSIEFFRATGGKKYHELEWPKIFRLVAPHERDAGPHQPAVLTGLEIRRALLCDRGHVENLVLSGQLTAVKKSQPGPGGSWVIRRDSFETWLHGRLQ